jgi:uncharacterized protein YcfJ
MKQVILAVAFVATPALADSVYGTVEDHYRDHVVTIPHVERVCNTVEVPIYGQEQFDQGGAIVGGIVGGLLGSQIGKGSGNKVATGAGAITGAIIGGKKEGGVVGYRREEQCQNETTYERKYERKYSHSTVQFTYEGREYKVRFTK